MSDDIGLETAWNLYRAIRTYDVVQDALRAARAATIGQSEARGGTACVADPDGFGMPRRYTQQELTNLVRHARYIVSRHNLDDARVLHVIGASGRNRLVQAIADELCEGRIADCERFRIDAGTADIAFPALVRAPDARECIIINPLAYRDEAAFLAHMRTELPRLYREIVSDNKQKLAHRAAAVAETGDQHTKRLIAMTQRLDQTHPDEAQSVFADADSDDTARQAILQKLGFTRAEATRGAKYLDYTMERWVIRAGAIRDTPDGLQWRAWQEPKDRNSEAAPKQKGRVKPVPTLSNRVAQWAEHRAGGIPKYKLADGNEVVRRNLIASIQEIESLFRVAPQPPPCPVGSPKPID